MKASKKRKATNRVSRISKMTLREEETNTLIALALEVLEQRHQPGALIASPKAAEDYLRLKLSERKNEVFGCVFMDNRNRVIAIEELFNGTIDGTSVYPRTVVQRALELNAAALLLYHNHPSGVAEPSQADERITQRLKSALALVDIRVIDHLVVAFEGCTSLASRGCL